ncbi:MAG TPA: metallopeptidase TldD-related protein [Edaphobacter sp.]|nr:metallopeptidase TldD-related protein [Edaphobacter sp.]
MAAASCLCIFSTTFSVAQKPSDDPLLRAMQAELGREKALLVLPGMQRPYFIEYQLDDLNGYELVANYGALTREESNHQRVVRVTVRVGDYAVDSSSSHGDGASAFAPSDNNPEALKYALWIATDTAYKNALQAYAAKQAALKQFQAPRMELDFAEAKPAVHVDPLVSMDLDRKEWKRRIIEASGLFETAPEVRASAEQVQYSTANLRAVTVNRYLVNTEGTVVRHGYTGYAAGISVGGQAPDGMLLGRDNASTAADAKELETWPVFRKRVIDDLKSFAALQAAPVVPAEDYHGPILFSGDAASDVMAHLFVPHIEADRPAIGTTGRTTGEYASSYKSRVLPAILDVTDNPLMAKFDGKTLLGAYTVDDEGVPAESVDVVVKGILQSYLIGREPVKDFPSSNGHGRSPVGRVAQPQAGVVIVKSPEAVPVDELNKRLLAMAKEQGREVYAVETLGGALEPRVLYRVHADGTRELVRGAVFDELDNRTLRSDIVAAGNDPYVSNSLGPVPQTMIAPSLLFDDVGIKRATEEQHKLPYYPPPALDGK